ncbi:hypothetical protein [Microbacterium algeriense]|uniref:hypothetical protein n=1 Tax=Microbacterium algeriense TaxID=2615184 RepID=UPI0029A04495|nr:hypothetical protein [Microbacterium algeriense]MDX2398496.1 hypothetical protein [Microbacterium algeriense]
MKTTLAGFNAGNIISDAVFTNKSTMTEAQIQSFFNGKVARCLGGRDENNEPIVCLKDFRMNTVSRPGDAYCSGYSGAANESAARIIYRVAQACNINPQVLIVMLQKEQGLITHTWPSAWRYRIALGQGCPDTAPCDPNYIGFFHQIYGAARQMQIYMEGRWFQWYAPGRTWNILYNPKASCGSSPVAVANKATSALYYYTPYQPNAAALRAGYGTGDGCSAYGNRNFYNYFTDWFGSTQGIKRPDGPIVNVGKDIYAITNGTAYHITADVWGQYKAAFGDPAPTTNDHIGSLRQGGAATLFLQDASTLTVSYLSDGKTHRFPTCDLVASWGSNCNALTKFDSDDFRRPGAGPEMTVRAKMAGDARVFVIEGKDLVPYGTAAAATAWGQNPSLYAATMTPGGASKYRAIPTRFVPGEFITIAGSTRVYLPTSDGELHYVSSFDFATHLGLPVKVTKNVAATAVAQHRTTTDLSRFVSCDGRVYFAAGGTLWRVASSGGFGVAAVDARTCALLRIGNDTASPLFVNGAGDSAIHMATGGVFRHVANPATLTALNGPGAVRVVTLAAADMAAQPKGAMLRADIGFVVTPGDGRVYLADAGRLIYLNSWLRADDLGLPRQAVAISDAAGAAMPKAGTVTTVVRCNGVLHSAAAGKLTIITDPRGVAITELSPANCATLKLPTR